MLSKQHFLKFCHMIFQKLPCHIVKNCHVGENIYFTLNCDTVKNRDKLTQCQNNVLSADLMCYACWHKLNYRSLNNHNGSGKMYSWTVITKEMLQAEQPPPPEKTCATANRRKENGQLRNSDRTMVTVMYLQFCSTAQSTSSAVFHLVRFYKVQLRKYSVFSEQFRSDLQVKFAFKHKVRSIQSFLACRRLGKKMDDPGVQPRSRHMDSGV